MTDLQLRHWQQIKQAQALEYAGTPEGNAALVESRRYGMAADRIEELAAQVEVMQSQRYELMGVLVELDNGFEFNEVCENTIRRVTGILSQKTQAAAILRQRDARILREAALIFDKEAGLAGCDNMTTVAGDRLRKMAKELENGE